ncbi:unnamed protein product, partial [Mesorhabditis belari]|uniref:Translocon-associated protein subunit gamma n=1 Tax=Mesorhabditis belari TaxID=2138241 RepID=A0AAF3F1G9_9BILA
MTKKNANKFSKEEEILLNSFSPELSKKGSALFVVNSLVSSLAPIFLFYGVHQLEVDEAWMVWTATVLISTYLLTMAAKNEKHKLKHKLVQKRTQAIEREINKKYADDKKMTRKEKDERALFRRNEVADNESTWLSIFYNNMMFFGIFIILAFFFFANVSPLINSVVSIISAAGFVAFISTAKN